MKKNFENKIKEQIMPSVCRCFGDFTWRPNYEWHRTFVDSGVIKNYTRVDVDDVFIGSYKSVGIKVIEAMYETGSGRYRQTVFDGVIVKLDMNKNFKGHTILTDDKLFHNSPVRHLKRTELEDVEFEKKYDVFTDDPIEARYILTPALMEKIKKIKVAIYCKELKCAFYQNNLIISIATGDKDLFSIGSLVRPVADPEQFKELMEQFVSILELIDILELDKKVML